MLKTYPRLSEICPEGSDSLPLLDQVLRYICLLYDPKSPLILQERDLNYRKQVAAELAGFSAEDEEFTSAMHESKLDWVVLLISRFLIRFIKQRQWAYIVALEFKFWESVRRIMQPIKKGTDVKDWDELKSIEIKAKISDEADKDIKRLDTLYKAFFNEDEGLENATKNIRISPEMIAGGGL